MKMLHAPFIGLVIGDDFRFDKWMRRAVGTAVVNGL
jgi:hypothetical protein